MRAMIPSGRMMHLDGFTGPDPIGYDDQWNLYAYVGNDPINNVDPSGRSSEDSKCSLRRSNAGNCTVFSFMGNSAKSAFIKGAKAAANGASAAQQDPESFKKGVGQGIANGVANTINGVVAIGEIASPTLTLGSVPDVPTFGPGDNAAENFGQIVGETGFQIATAAAVAPKAVVTTANVIGKVSTSGLTGSVARGLGNKFGQQGPIFGQSRLGAPTTGLLNGGRLRIGFTAHKNTAIFRIGIGNNRHINLFTRPRIPK